MKTLILLTTQSIEMRISAVLMLELKDILTAIMRSEMQISLQSGSPPVGAWHLLSKLTFLGSFTFKKDRNTYRIDKFNRAYYRLSDRQ